MRSSMVRDSTSDAVGRPRRSTIEATVSWPSPAAPAVASSRSSLTLVHHRHRRRERGRDERGEVADHVERSLEVVLPEDLVQAELDLDGLTEVGHEVGQLVVAEDPRAELLGSRAGEGRARRRGLAAVGELGRRLDPHRSRSASGRQSDQKRTENRECDQAESRTMRQLSETNSTRPISSTVRSTKPCMKHMNRYTSAKFVATPTDTRIAADQQVVARRAAARAARGTTPARSRSNHRVISLGAEVVGDLAGTGVAEAPGAQRDVDLVGQLLDAPVVDRAAVAVVASRT